MRRSGFTAQGIRAESKRIAVFFADSRLRVVGMGGGGWKRIAFGGNKERFVRIKGFWFAKKLAFSAHTRLSDKEKTFSAHNDADFTLHQS